MMPAARDDGGVTPFGGITPSGGRTLLETLIVTALVSILLAVAAERFYSSSREIRETALRIELSNVRGAINRFALLEKRLPASLKELAEKKAVISKQEISGGEYRVVFESGFIENMTVGSDGALNDPFGNPYGYDPSTGKVNSSTRGYEKW